MKILKTCIILGICTNAYASEYFTELRLGLEDSYHKAVQHQTKGKLEGDFRGMKYGLRFGKYFGMHSFAFEYNPEQNVEIKSANELAKVSSSFLIYRYHFENNFFAGAQLGYSSFELVKGPGGVTFNDNPTTKGLTYGINLGYQYKLNDKFFTAVQGSYNFGKYKTNGPGTTPVNTIEIQNQHQISLNLGYRF